ncbi:LMO4 family protein [Megaselia abdita]
MTEYHELESGEYIGGAAATTPPSSEDSPYKVGLNNNIKLAATVAMNTSYHPYSDITSPPHHLNPHHQPPPPHHQPPPSPSDSGSNFGGYHNGSSGGSGVQTPQLTPMDDVVSPPDFHHHSNHLQQQHQHLHLNNNNNNNNSPIKQCAGCGEKISDRFLLHALDRFWHNSCLKCSCCQRLLADLGTSCFSKGGYILCKKDYSRGTKKIQRARSRSWMVFFCGLLFLDGFYCSSS